MYRQHFFVIVKCIYISWTLACKRQQIEMFNAAKSKTHSMSYNFDKCRCFSMLLGVQHTFNLAKIFSAV